MNDFTSLAVKYSSNIEISECEIAVVYFYGVYLYRPRIQIWAKEIILIRDSFCHGRLKSGCCDC